MRRRHVVAIHDVAPPWMEEVRALRALVRERHGGPVALLVVPRFRGVGAWSAADAAWLRAAAAAGDEIVLHGLTHGRPDDERELRGLDVDGASASLEDGLAILAGIGLSPRGLIAPCYAQPRGGAAAVASRVGLAWCADRRGVVAGDRRVRAPAIGLGASTRVRRAVTPAAAQAALRVAMVEPAVRLDLHPADLRHPRLRRAAVALVERCAAGHGTAVRHADLLVA